MLTDEPSVPPPGDFAATWAAAQINALSVNTEAFKFPRYGTAEWAALPANDPRRAAAVIEAAELWRWHVASEAWLDTLDDGDWYAEVFGDARANAAQLAKALGRMRSFKELRDARAKPGPVHEVKAAPGWGPVAIPGRPGWWRHHIDGQQVDMPHRNTERIAA